MAYRILARPDGYDTSLWPEEFETVDAAVKEAMSMMLGDDFLIVTVVNWKGIGDE